MCLCVYPVRRLRILYYDERRSRTNVDVKTFVEAFNGMATDDPFCREPLVSVEFQVFGKVQGVYFPKYVKDICIHLGICGWVKNSKTGTILGKMQGPQTLIEQMKDWLTSVGSPDSEIHHCEFTNWEYVSKRQYVGFVIRV